MTERDALDVAALATEYRTALEAQAASLGLEPEVSRRAAEDVQRTYMELRQSPSGRDAIEAVARDPKPMVALPACVHALAWRSAAALQCLEDFASGPKPAAPIAKILLAEYHRSDEMVTNLGWEPDGR